jgi:DNA-binding transcriptional LysR family regulator
MINLPVRHILTLVCLADTGSFRRAGERLHLSQPAVSAHIRDLEKHFGVPLVHRTTRHVSLTAEGRAFAARARRAFEELDMASRDLRELAVVHRGRVVIACIPPLMTRLVPTAIRRIERDYPAVEVEIRDVLSTQVEEFVAHSDADFGIGPRPSSTKLSFAMLERDDFVVAVPRGHALADRSVIDFDELAAFPLVTITREASGRRMLDRAIERSRKTFRTRFELVHNFSVGGMVAAGLGLAVLPRRAIPTLGRQGIVTLEIRSPRISREIGFISRPEYQPSPSARAFMSVLKECFAQEAPARGRVAQSER